MENNNKHNISPLIIGLHKGISESLPDSKAKELENEIIKANSNNVDLSEVFFKWSILMLKRIRSLEFDDTKRPIGNAIADHVRAAYTNAVATHTRAAGSAAVLAGAYADTVLAANVASASAHAVLAGAYADTVRAAAFAVLAADSPDTVRVADYAFAAASFAADAGDSITQQKEDLLNLLKNAKKVKND